MPMNTINYHAYTIAIIEQADVHVHQLNELSSLNRNLTFLEQTATERSLQIIIEALIGSAKQLGKKLSLPIRNDSWQSVKQVIDYCQLDNSLDRDLKGAIGMRNTIVHDYLLLDWEIIGDVLSNRRYNSVVDTIKRFCQELAIE